MSPRLERRHALSPVTFVVAVLALVMGMLTAAPTTSAQAAAPLPDGILDGGYIISDAEFFDSTSMTATEVKAFLKSKVPTCKATSGPTCLKSFTADLPKFAADKYCKEVPAKDNASSAWIIYKVARSCGINPKVILVMLQKEQGLVLSTAPTDWSYRAAMGQACPDTAPCDKAAAGFVNQVYKGARQLQVYTKNPTSFNYRAGQVNTIKWHPTSSCGSSKVHIKNQATANLYIYTPYRPNVAALAAGTGTGDACSSYGNRNFYNFYVSWFEPKASSSTGAPAQIAACSTPPSGDIAAASGTGTMTAATTGKKAPTKNCTSGTTSLAKGASVTVTGSYGSWLRVKSGSKTTWVPKSTVKLPTSPASGGDVCALPAESAVTKASGTAVVTTDTLNARKAPTTKCETGKKQIKMGAKYARTATYRVPGDDVWWRITISGSPYWVHSQYVTLDDPSSEPVPTPNPTPTPADEAVPATGTKYVKSALAVKSGTKSSSRLLSTLATGTKVTRTATKGSYTKVSAGSVKGWVASSKLVDTKPAVSTSTMQTTAAKSYVRIAADNDTKAVVKLAKGTKVTVVDRTSTWAAVKVSGKQGWVLLSKLGAAKETAPADEAVPATGTKYVKSALAVKSGTKSSSRLLSTLATGTKVTRTATKGSYTKVSAGSVRGWVASSKLVDAKPAVSTSTMQTTAAKSYVRIAADNDTKAVVKLAKGTKVTVVDRTSTWAAVKVSGKEGWVLLNKLGAVAGTTMTTTTALNLRASASTSAKVVDVLAKGTKVTVTASKGAWRNVTVGGQTGWVHSDYLK